METIMDNIQYYVIVDKLTINNNTDKVKINEVEIKIQDTKLPFSDKYIDLYLISQDKNECKKIYTKYKC